MTLKALFKIGYVEISDEQEHALFKTPFIFQTDLNAAFLPGVENRDSSNRVSTQIVDLSNDQLCLCCL